MNAADDGLPNSDGDDDEALTRRAEELEALRAFYGDDLMPRLPARHEHGRSGCDDDAALSANGPWFVRFSGERFVLGPPTLEMRLPRDYPMGAEPPLVLLHNVMMNQQKKDELISELIEMHVPDTEVAITWAERCREELAEGNVYDCDCECTEKSGSTVVESQTDEGTTHEEGGATDRDNEAVLTFVPSTSRYGQPVRKFPDRVISDESNRRTIYRGQPFHPPKSGKSELMIAHVASVSSMDHVRWVLAELLFQDKKVAKASHNMFAYRFYQRNVDDEGCGSGEENREKEGVRRRGEEERVKRRQYLVADNDDDGEKGSGAKLAALLQLSDADDVLVVVSRWFGGTHLGPARFKHIACTARDALRDAGFIGIRS